MSGRASTVTTLLVALALSGCGRTDVVVGSKKFTESVLLGEIAAGTLQARGVPARHRAQLGGTRVLWAALLAGEIDAYPEYTGTLCEEILKIDCEPGTLAAALRTHGVQATPSLGFRDEYALAMREEQAARLGLRTISDLRAHPELRLGFSEEFLARSDGWPALRARYHLPHTDVRGLDHDLAWRGLSAGSLDLIDAYTTDAELRATPTRLLEDDQGFFRNYEALLLLHGAALRPEARGALESLAGRIDERQMVDLNARARIDHQPEAQVAAAWLSSHGLAPASAASPGSSGAPDGLPRRLLHRTVEHLLLSGLSLAGAIALGVPLGILAWRRRRLGQAILGLTGLVQTIPSLALLVFMIPLFGIGAVPALAALLVYSLLPIVRNTVAGLEGIPAPLRESAEVLGLSTGDRLRLVELPLAMPSILAGIQTAAVIGVGTATLGALIGAGGYGQAILTGIRLDDVGLILEGAVPAALLALGVQGSFGLVSPWLVSPGLRPGSRSPVRGAARAPEA